MLPPWKNIPLALLAFLLAFSGPDTAGVAALGDSPRPDKGLALKTSGPFGKNQTRYFIAEGRRDSVRQALERSGRYQELIREELAAEGLPADLAYLPLLESEFDPSAVSRAGAAGLWQLMPETARWFGLEVSKRVDERLDPVKSTRAAVKLLKELKMEFGDWETALAAYNCGRGPVRAVRAGRKSRLPRETRLYVPRFAAAVKVGRFPLSYGIDPSYENPLQSESENDPKQEGGNRRFISMDFPPKP